jgi:hypothetical protein
MGEISKYRAKERVVDYGIMALTCLVQINHIFYILRKSETKSNDSDTVHIIGNTFRFDGAS